MRKWAALIAVILVLSAVPVLASHEFNILKVDKRADASQLWAAGFLYLADLGDTYLVQGDDNALGRG